MGSTYVKHLFLIHKQHMMKPFLNNHFIVDYTDVNFVDTLSLCYFEKDSLVDLVSLVRGDRSYQQENIWTTT